MKVLKQGVHPSDRWHKGTCHTCWTEVEFQGKEAEQVPDSRDGNYLKVKCPTCGGLITSMASKYQNTPYSTPVDNTTFY